MIELIENLVLSFRGKEMNATQNMAVYNLIEEVMGKDAATAFSEGMESSDEFHNDKTTYTFNRDVYDVWITMLSTYMDKHVTTVRKHEMTRNPGRFANK